MSLRATEFEARVWRVARERLSRRPKLLAEFYRRRWGRWLELLVLFLAAIALPVPLFAIAVQLANANVFPGGRFDDGVSLLAAGMLGASLLFAWIWHHMARFDGLWSIAQTAPFSDTLLARHWLFWRVGFAGVFIAPLATFHAIELNRQPIGWGAAMAWGTLVSVAEMATLMATTTLIAAAVGRWLRDGLKVFFFFVTYLVLALISILPIQLAPRGVVPRVQFAGRQLLWFPTGWPLAMFESAMQADFAQAIWWMVGVIGWSAIGLIAASHLIRHCMIREFVSNSIGPRLSPLFKEESVWGPTVSAEPRVLSKWEIAFGGNQGGTPASSVDFVKLETQDEPLSLADARQEVLRGEFLQPISDERLGWLETVLRLSFFDRERTLANCLLIDGRYWSRAVKIWWACIWFTAFWFGFGALLRQFAGLLSVWVVVPLLLMSVVFFALSIITTIWVGFIGWPGLIWTNSANKGLPLFAHLPISVRELSAVRQRVVLLKLIVVLAVSFPVLAGITWVTGAPLWPILKVVGKLVFALFVIQSWWFFGWQLSGSFFRTVNFYFKSIVLLLGYLTLAVWMLVGDDHIEWAAPSMVLCAKLMTWMLQRTLDRPIFDLTGANMPQQNRGLMVNVDVPRT